MSWLMLLFAGVFEVAWAVGLKQLQSSNSLLIFFFTAVSFIASFILLSFALKSLPLGTAYAIWTGIGALGTFILGIVLFQESISPIRLACAGMLIIGLLGLKFFSS